MKSAAARITRAFSAVLFCALLASCGGGSDSFDDLFGNPAVLFPARVHDESDLRDEFGPPTPRDAGEIRDGDGDMISPTTITGALYSGSGVSSSHRVFVQKLTYARLGIWDTRRGDKDYRYADLDDNRVTPPSGGTAPTAIYNVEGDAVYEKGGVFYNIYPDGSFIADFAAGTIRGTISVDGSDKSDDFGDSNAMLGNIPVAADDDFSLSFTQGDIGSDGFTCNLASNNQNGCDVTVTASGFFSDLDDASNGNFNGAFYDHSSFTDEPEEIAGEFDAGSRGYKLRGGFLGKKQ